MLADRRVVEPHVLGQLRHGDRAEGAGDTTEDGMARRITERPGLLPNHGEIHRLHSPQNTSTTNSN